MRIMMIAPTPFFADRGCHTRIYGEITALQRLGHEVELVTYGLGRDIEGVKTVRSYNFPWYKKLTAGPSVWKILLLPFIYHTARKEIKRYNPDIVHAHLHEGAFIAKFCKTFDKNKKRLYVFDLQGSLSGEIIQHKFVKENGIFHKFFIALEKKINSWFPIITQSENLYNQLITMGVEEERIVNAMDAVDTTAFAPTEPDKELVHMLDLDNGKKKVLFMGLLESYQGVDYMFDAFGMVKKQYENVEFIVIGFPNIDKYRAKAKELGIAKDVKFIGKVRFEDVPSYLSLSKIAIAPKIASAEGDGKIYNYMAMGMSVVAFDRSISREILRDTGIFAKMKDSKDMADKILSLLNDDELVERLGKAARQRAVDYLSTDISAAKIDEFYKKNLK